MPDDPAGLWQTVRRALGRLVSATRVDELPLADLVPIFGAPVSLVISAPGTGAAEAHWRPLALAAEVPLPQTSAGAGKADLTPDVTVVRMEAAPSPEAGVVLEAALPPPACTTHRLDAAELRGQSLAVVSPPIVFLVTEVGQAAVRFASPGTAHLLVEAPTLSRGTRLRWGGRRIDSDDPLRLAGGRVRPGTGMLAQIPLKRVGRPVPKGVPAAEAFAAEWQLLAQKAGIAPEDVVLVGVFPQVPVAAVRRLALEEGTLCLWLKPEALVAAAAGRVPRLATLIVGRQRSTGKMIQTVA